MRTQSLKRPRTPSPPPDEGFQFPPTPPASGSPVNKKKRVRWAEEECRLAASSEQSPSLVRASSTPPTWPAYAETFSPSQTRTKRPSDPMLAAVELALTNLHLTRADQPSTLATNGTLILRQAWANETRQGNEIDNHVLADGLISSTISGVCSGQTSAKREELAIGVDQSLTEINFMNLSTVGRREVYKQLLCVPGLICVRQNLSVYEHYSQAYSNAGGRRLLPGIGWAAVLQSPRGMKKRFSLFAFTNINILCANKIINEEAATVFYGSNTFEFPSRSLETVPSADFSIPLFRQASAALVRKLCIRSSTLYGLKWTIITGHHDILKAYPHLQSLTLILELDSISKNIGKLWARRSTERWRLYIIRLQRMMEKDIYGYEGLVKSIPAWIDLRAVFDGETFDRALDLDLGSYASSEQMQNVDDDDVEDEEEREERRRVDTRKKTELKRAVAEAWELFKKGGR